MSRPDMRACKSNREMILVMSEYMFGCLEGIDKNIVAVQKVNEVQETQINKNTKDIHTGNIIIRIAGVLFTGITVIVGIIIRFVTMESK